MKRTLCVMVLLGIVCGATFAVTSGGGVEAVSDPVNAAIQHAYVDGRAYQATGWGWLGFGSSMLLGPLFGGGGVILYGNLTYPNTMIPETRMLTATQQYTGTDLLLYKAHYRDTKAAFVQRDRSRRAVIGTVVGASVNAVVLGVSSILLFVMFY